MLKSRSVKTWIRIFVCFVILVLLVLASILVSLDIIALSESREKVFVGITGALAALLTNLLTLAAPPDRGRGRLTHRLLDWCVGQPILGVDGLRQRDVEAVLTPPGLRNLGVRSHAEGLLATGVITRGAFGAGRQFGVVVLLRRHLQ